MNNRLKEIRTRLGISLVELSRRTKIANTDICNVEAGNIRAWPGWRARIAAALNVPASDIWQEEIDANQ